MNLIMENWRSFLKKAILGKNKIKATNQSIQKIVDKFLEEEKLYIAIVELEKRTVIEYSKDGLGRIQIIKNDRYTGPCLDAWVVMASQAKSGWGPLLYEVAIEWATENGSGLTPDRDAVSPDALGVWKKYYSRSDVRKAQLDSHPNFDDLDQLTPKKPQDDCSQYMSLKVSKDRDNWHKSPLSKVYSKKPNLIKQLMQIKKIIVM